jgi:hypothetical protein
MALASATSRVRVRSNCFRDDTKASLLIHYELKRMRKLHFAQMIKFDR